MESQSLAIDPLKLWKKDQASATLILLNLAKFNESNVADRPDFFLKSFNGSIAKDWLSYIYIWWFGGSWIELFQFGAVIAQMVLTYVIFGAF